ncbi:hypothetical protein CDAR_318031 [Caerostris darwini]|uniref:Uncharacterized protein n=1 Tax=Caerostris darwini TaxID=1538125 RepID=A0AAV4WUZ0_9ARAC|nr:hypothetical protein CDAR_318031 [Caerostris darwini]
MTQRTDRARWPYPPENWRKADNPLHHYLFFRSVFLADRSLAALLSADKSGLSSRPIARRADKMLIRVRLPFFKNPLCLWLSAVGIVLNINGNGQLVLLICSGKASEEME